jgi:hypothetical protein
MSSGGPGKTVDLVNNQDNEPVGNLTYTLLKVNPILFKLTRSKEMCRFQDLPPRLRSIRPRAIITMP